MRKLDRYLLTGIISFGIVALFNMISPVFDNPVTILGSVVIIDSLFSKDYGFAERIIWSVLTFCGLGLSISLIKIILALFIL